MEVAMEAVKQEGRTLGMLPRSGRTTDSRDRGCRAGWSYAWVCGRGAEGRQRSRDGSCKAGWPCTSDCFMGVSRFRCRNGERES
eukprot:781846-Heterocapsa_arctica.AAC.1